MSEMKTPVPVAIIGTGDGGMTPTDQRIVAHTPDDQPNLYVRVITPALALAVRYVKAFLVAFSGLLAASNVGITIFPSTTDSVVVLAAWAAFWVANTDLLKNLITVFGKLEGKYPLSTGSI